MQTVYIGNTLINDVYIGSERYTDVLSTDGLNQNVVNYISASGITSFEEMLAVNELYNSLASNSILDKMIAVYPMLGNTSTQTSINLITTSSFNLSYAGGVTFNGNGIVTNGTNGYANTSFQPIDQPSYQTSLAFGAYSITEGPESYDMGSQIIGSGGGQIALIIDLLAGADERFYPGIPTSVFYTGTEVSGRGFYQASRVGTRLLGTINNNTVVDVDPATNVDTFNPIDKDFYIGAFNENGTATAFSARNYVYSFIAAGLTESEMLSHNEIVQTFQSSLRRI